jgi:hypothetical protein
VTSGGVSKAAELAEAVFQQALGLHRAGRLDKARRLYRRTLELHPQEVRALHLLGVIAAQTHHSDDAVRLFSEAAVLAPQIAAIHNDLGNAQAELVRYEFAIESYDQAIALAPGWADAHYNRANALFELHDRARFEVSALSYGPVMRDALRDRVERAFDRFLDVHGRSERDIAANARNLELDIAVDLAGYTGEAKIFAHRPAPIQVSYLGYVGTLGADFMDYLIADETIIHAASRNHYREKILYLPSYQANSRTSRRTRRLYARSARSAGERLRIFLLQQ